MNDHVAKPVEPEALYAALRRWLPAPSDAPSRSSAGAAAGEEDEVWRRRLAAVPGLDPARGLAMVRGNLALYRRLLTLFVDGHGHGVERLRERLQADDLAEVQRLAHILKGSAGNLGATPVQAAADALQAAIRQGAGRDNIERCFQSLATALPPLLDGLRSALADEDAAPAANPTRLATVLARLEALLEQGDIAANDLARTEAPLLRAGLDAAGDTLLRQIANFDYEAALAILRVRPGRGARRN